VFAGAPAEQDAAGCTQEPLTLWKRTPGSLATYPAQLALVSRAVAARAPTAEPAIVAAAMSKLASARGRRFMRMSIGERSGNPAEPEGV
jgi:hypothetical protein